jgi:hypothetical protein
MYQYTLSITFQGMQYLTNVIADKDTPEQEIYQVALAQVQTQWGEKKEH